MQARSIDRVCFLQPYHTNKISRLEKSPPTVQSPIPLYLSITSNLNSISYEAEIVGWEDKRDIPGERREALDQEIRKHQPAEERGLYAENNKGKLCANLLSIRGLRKLPTPMPVAQLTKIEGGEPVGQRSKSGGWVYVGVLPDRSVASLDMNRKAQTLLWEKLEVGTPYSRSEIASIGQVPPLQNSREWTGITEFDNCVLLFVTLDKTEKGEAHQYHDEFDGNLFQWDSQKRNTAITKVIKRLREDNPQDVVLLFARENEKIKSKTQPFYYCGKLRYQGSFLEKPVRFHWALEDFPAGLVGSPELESLGQWKVADPDNGGSSGKGRGSISEGAKKTVVVNRYERDHRARQECIDEFGAKCWVCDYDYSKLYGPLGEAYIEVHHCVPMAVRRKKGVYNLDPLNDLKPLCANCHRMVHRKPKLEPLPPGNLKEEAWGKFVELRELAALDSWEELEG